jgi:hypothetical protein
MRCERDVCPPSAFSVFVFNLLEVICLVCFPLFMQYQLSFFLSRDFPCRCCVVLCISQFLALEAGFRISLSSFAVVVSGDATRRDLSPYIDYLSFFFLALFVLLYLVELSA